MFSIFLSFLSAFSYDLSQMFGTNFRSILIPPLCPSIMDCIRKNDASRFEVNDRDCLIIIGFPHWEYRRLRHFSFT